MKPTSVHHSFLKEVRRAAAAGRATEEGLIVAEGPHLLEEALRGLWGLEYVITTAAGAERYAELLAGLQAEIVRIPAKSFAQIATTEQAQEVLALLRPKPFSLSDLAGSVPVSGAVLATEKNGSVPVLVVVLDGIQDPGNAGTIVRSAEAFGATGVILLQGSVRMANAKFLRAAAGSLFRLPVVEKVNARDAIRALGEAGVRLMALTAHGGKNLRETDLRLATALVVGSEGAGISSELLHAASPMRIPTGRVESLNAAVACSLALFEAHNQRVANESL